jgi:hypothetical protein
MFGRIIVADLDNEAKILSEEIADQDQKVVASAEETRGSIPMKIWMPKSRM